MPRASGEKQYNTFTKGLITEANPLTYPENSFLDGDNIVLNRDGSIVRRLGIDYEDGYSLVATTLTGATVSFHSWEFAGGSSGVSLGVVRVRDRLYFMDMTSAAPSSNLKNGGNYITLAGLSNARIETTVINNNLVVVGSELNYPIYLEYNLTTDVVSQSAISIKVRDFWGVDDGLTLKETPSTLSKEHLYNLRNQGWIYHLSTVKLQSGQYPSNSDMYHYGKFEDSWSYPYFSNNREALAQAPKGHFILDIYNRGTSRTAEIGTTLDNDGELGRISTATTYSGRVFYAGVASEVVGGDKYSPNYSGYVFFTKTVGTKEDLSICYQEADPTSADISDIIATDGGTLAIPDANRIVRLAAVGNSLIIFSENGVWEVYGTSDSGFKATEYSLRKITNIGVRNPDSVVVAGDSVFYWAKSGIFMLSTEQVSGRLQAQNISLATIQAFYDNIPTDARENIKGFYDQKENKVRWLFSEADIITEVNILLSTNFQTDPCGDAIWVGNTLLTSGYNIIVTDIATPWPVAYTKLTFNFTFTGVLTSGNIAISCAETGGIFQTMGSINAGVSSFTYELLISSPSINNDFSFIISYDNPDGIEWSLNTIYAAE